MENQHRLLVSMIAKNTVDTPAVLADFVQNVGGQLKFCRFYTFGDLGVATSVLIGTWAMPEKAEKLAHVLEAQHDMTIRVRPITKQEHEFHQIALTVQVIIGVQKNVLADLLEFFKSREMKVVDMYAEEFASGHANTVMTTLGLTVCAGLDTRLNILREDFLEYCDELNIDGMIELEKP